MSESSFNGTPIHRCSSGALNCLWMPGLFEKVSGHILAPDSELAKNAVILDATRCMKAQFVPSVHQRQPIPSNEEAIIGELKSSKDWSKTVYCQLFSLILVLVLIYVAAYVTLQNALKQLNRVHELAYQANARIQFENCLGVEIPRMVSEQSENLPMPKASSSILFRCLQKQHAAASEVSEELPCYLLLAYIDTAKGKASANRFIDGVSKVLDICNSFLVLDGIVWSNCYDIGSDMVSKASCAVWRDLHLRSSDDEQLRLPTPLARLRLLTIGLPSINALTQGAAVNHLKKIWSVNDADNTEGPFNVDALSGLINGNVISLVE